MFGTKVALTLALCPTVHLTKESRTRGGAMNRSARARPPTTIPGIGRERALMRVHFVSESRSCARTALNRGGAGKRTNRRTGLPATRGPVITTDHDEPPLKKKKEICLPRLGQYRIRALL